MLVVDEAYVAFGQEPSAATLVPRYDNLLVTRTLSKDHALAGLRVGYALGQRGLIEGLLRVKDSFNSYPVDSLAIAAAAAALQDEDYFPLAAGPGRQDPRLLPPGAARARVCGPAPRARTSSLRGQTSARAGALCRPAPAHVLVRRWDAPRGSRVPAHLHRHAGGDGKSARHP